MEQPSTSALSTSPKPERNVKPRTVRVLRVALGCISSPLLAQTSVNRVLSRVLPWKYLGTRLYHRSASEGAHASVHVSITTGKTAYSARAPNNVSGFGTR